ncbi:hypothetical protein M2175_005338 [Bradyrhizobium elkanii]|uniref:Pectate lyase superfamily protein domain-containing protein n=1 Tax=Bradyrhizobium japonicum TaxID=375 RepID=A0A1L3FFZ3_BRAJP|nr:MULTISPECIES: hypothetical protein [Bradyrhizobium]APG12210.1 hypothetical protein BKD09_28135 [Bradyrhizobium japonicum]MCS3930307.1 hypothetical protein [Bradyrhizobium elkanii]MCS3970864.1 hypothetical protein [Bradyrhizobium japonicum]
MSHTSGVFATDLAAGKWLFITAVAAGPQGPQGNPCTNGTDGVDGADGTNGVNGIGYGGTSITSLTIGAGTKTFATQNVLAYLPGNYVRASSVANGANFMEGAVASYSGGALTLNVTSFGGAGTFADWTFSVAGLPGTLSSYAQAESGAVSSPLIRRLNNTLFASEFGAVGDDTTNDYTSLQAFLNAVASSGKEGRFDSGKRYFVSGNDLTFTGGAGHNGRALFGYGAQLRTDPSQFGRVGLVITRPNFTFARPEEARITLIEGLSFNAYQNGNGAFGIQGTGISNLVLRNLSFASGADGGTPPNVNYAAINLKQTSNVDPDTGCFWIEIEHCRFRGGATGMPNALWLEGAINAVSITQNNFANVDTAIRLLAADRTGTDTANAATIPNGVKMIDNSFEGILDGIKFNGNTTTTNKSRSVGLQV